MQSTKRSLSRGEEERNPLLGKHPSDKKVNAAGAIAGIGTLLAANALPERYRAGFLGGVAGFEHTVAKQNESRKYRPTFADAIKKPLAIGIATGLLAHYLTQTPDIGYIMDKELGPGITFNMKF